MPTPQLFGLSDAGNAAYFASRQGQDQDTVEQSEAL
jgi:hypothetical protein